MRHLRLIRPDEVPPEPAPRPYPRSIDGIELRRVGYGRWWITRTSRGRVFDLWLTTAELEDLVGVAHKKLVMDREDVP